MGTRKSPVRFRYWGLAIHNVGGTLRRSEFSRDRYQVALQQAEQRGAIAQELPQPIRLGTCRSEVHSKPSSDPPPHKLFVRDAVHLTQQPEKLRFQGHDLAPLVKAEHGFREESL